MIWNLRVVIMDLRDWLRDLGLEQYEALFNKNGIDAEVLPYLTNADLEELGVLLGHRKRLLKAIAGLKIAAGQPLAFHAAAKPESKPHDAAERRQLTIMFCDLVGSTAMSTRLDPEDMRGVIAAYHKCCATLIADNGGFVAKYMGDGVLIYFGYPQADERDAEQAVRAGLAIVEAAPKLETAADRPLHVRVGIATGIVVVGDLLGSGEAQELGVVGDTPNLAARLQGIAEPDGVVVAEGTRKLLGNLFDFEDLGTKVLKGIEEPVRAWAALRPSSVANHFEALHSTGLTALVGRQEECELLSRRWATAKSGEGQVVLLCGEAGIGKSRLTAALLERLADEPHARLRYFCSPQHTDDALFPIIGELERAAGFSRGDTPKARLDKVDALLAYNSTSAPDALLFAEMLSLKNDGRYPAVELTPQQRRQRTLEALIAQIELLTRSRPALVIFEDAQWADPTSLEVLGRAVDRIRTLPVLLIATFRPEFDASWIGQSHVTALTLNRLGEREVGVMIDHVVGDKALPAGARRDIVGRSDGIPLFVEEMTKAVLEAEGDRKGVGTAALSPSSALTVPASLHASLMARLDRLGSAKEVAQIGAAIGREFSHAFLAAVVGRSEAELGSALARLIQTGLLFRQGAPPYAVYQFKHALVQDAAYGTLLRESRRSLHAVIVETLESQFAEIAEAQPALLARHCTEAGLIEKAASLWGKAGQRSLAHSALVEAAEQLNRALAQIAALPATPALRREQITLQVALTGALMHIKGYAAPETKAAEERARLLIEQAQVLGERYPMSFLSILAGFWAANFIAFNGEACQNLAEQILTIAEEKRTTVPLIMGNMFMGASLAWTGRLAEGRAHFDQAVRLYDPVKHRPLGTQFGIDYRVQILSYRSNLLWVLGYPDAALADAEFALKDANEIRHPATSMLALGFTSWTHICCGTYAMANVGFAELMAQADKRGSLYYNAIGKMGQGLILALIGKSADAIQAITSARAALKSTGTTFLDPSFLSFLAKAYADNGQFDHAETCISDAIAAVETTKERWWEAEIHRAAGEIKLLAPGRDVVEAQVCFERALAIARVQQAKSWELRAAASLARLWRDQGRRPEAHNILAPVYGGFAEGFDTIDLKEAKALLENLA